jgi:polyisoprenoid-binding protein YceI
MVFGRRAFLLAFLVLGGCGPSVQTATLRAPMAADTELAPFDQVVAASPPTSRRLAFRSPHARVHVLCNDLINGDHHLEFKSVRGRVLLDEKSGFGRIHVDVEMDHFKAESEFITSFARRMLEPHDHPHAILDAKIEPISDEPTKRLITGNMTLHGVERGITFKADFTDRGDQKEGLRLFAVFDMSRSAFNIHATAEDGEGIIRDDFTVTFDFRASKERATVEEVKDPPPPQPQRGERN